MKPRVGFLGLGWIGRHRMEALARSGRVDVAALADPDEAAVAAAREHAPNAAAGSSLDDLLRLPLDGIVIATPSAAHDAQVERALSQGLAVFCQKPLTTTAARAHHLAALSRRVDRLLGVDLSYRYLQATNTMRDLVRSGELGDIFHVELVFHNAYGPDKPWNYDRALSGGGCLMDLGIHLVDQLAWMFGESTPRVAAANVCHQGRPCDPRTDVEDFVHATLTLSTGTSATVACSWRAAAGADAVISITATGVKAGARVRNVNGSFYDFVAERLDCSRTEVLCAPPDDWGGRAAIAWGAALAGGGGSFDPEIERQADLLATLESIYEAASSAPVSRPRRMASSSAARASAV